MIFLCKTSYLYVYVEFAYIQFIPDLLLTNSSQTISRTQFSDISIVQLQTHIRIFAYSQTY